MERMKQNILKRALLALVFVAAITFGTKTDANAASMTISQVEPSINPSSNAKIQWSSVTGAKGYNITVLNADKTPANVFENGTTNVHGLTSTAYTIPSLASGTSYYVKVEACQTYTINKSNYTYEYSDVIGETDEFEIVTAPSVTSGTTYEVTNITPTTNTLSYGAVAGANQYRAVYYADGNTAVKEEAVSNTTDMVLTLSPNVYYYVNVYAERVSASGYVAQSSYHMDINTSKVANAYVATIPVLTGNLNTTYYTSIKRIGVGMTEKTPCANEYEFEYYDGRRNFASVTSNYYYGDYINTKYAAKNKIYTVYVRVARYDTAGKAYYSDPVTFYDCKYVSAKKLTSSDGKINVKWTKISGADRYVIYAAKGKQSDATKYKKVGTVKGKKKSFTITKFGKKKLKSGKKYSVYVQAQKKVNGEYVDVGYPYYYQKVTVK